MKKQSKEMVEGFEVNFDRGQTDEVSSALDDTEVKIKPEDVGFTVSESLEKTTMSVECDKGKAIVKEEVDKIDNFENPEAKNLKRRNKAHVFLGWL